MLDGARIELVREQTRDAAHPRVGGLRDDQVVARVTRREERLRVLDVDVAARIGERTLHARAEAFGGFDHKAFDLNRIDPLDLGSAKQYVGSKTRPDAYICHGPDVAVGRDS